jgi:intraflagellar transport protein 88
MYNNIANDLEIIKALSYLKIKDFSKAIETLKTFEKKDAKIASTAATNLSFLYFLVCVHLLVFVFDML